MEILFPCDKFLYEKILPRNLLPPNQPHPNAKNSPENVYALDNNHYCMQTIVKVSALQPLPRGLLGIKSSPKT